MWINNLGWSNLERRLKVRFLKPQAFISLLGSAPLTVAASGISPEFSLLDGEAFWFNGIH